MELENEELRMAQGKSQQEAERFIEMYDFAPSGFFEIAENGEIMELNLSGANLLGGNRSSLKTSMFGFFVSNDSKPVFNDFLDTFFSKRGKL